MIVATLATSCSQIPDGPDFGGSEGAGSGGPATHGVGVDAAGSSEAGTDDGDGTTNAWTDEGGGVFDVAMDDGGLPDHCSVGDDLDAVGSCKDQAPPAAFDPSVQWAYIADNGETNSVVIPLVGNLTDDDGNGTIDLCDVPDIVVLAYDCGTAPYCTDAHLHVLDGATGALHYRIDTPLYNSATPVIGDIDGDGLMEIVAIADPKGDGPRLIAFENDGTPKWISPDEGVVGSLDALALADVDADGDVEILDAGGVFDHQGNLVATWWESPSTSLAPTAADLDGDGDLEILLGGAAVHHDGSLYWEAFPFGGFGGGFPQVADLDEDDDPEVVLARYEGLVVLEHDGTVATDLLAPIAENEYDRPVTIHDFDGDGEAELAVKTETTWAVIERDGTLHWSTTVDELSYGSGGTAFDFLGDAVAEAVYADEHHLFVFDGAGAPLLEVPRTSFTAIEYPVVADVDNDGSAEIVVVSNRNIVGEEPEATVQVIRDAEDRWIPARRIWNQHAYHVTNVREDGTIPQHELPSWQLLNTFRTQAQIHGGGVCRPAG